MRDTHALFQTRKRFTNLKKDTRLAVEQYTRFPQSQKTKALKELERGFRADAATICVPLLDIDAAVKAIFHSTPVENEDDFQDNYAP